MQTATNNLIYELESSTYGTRVCAPLSEPNFTMTFTLVDDETTSPEYDYLVAFKGVLTFMGADYDWIKIIEDDIAHRGDDLLIHITDPVTGVELLPGTYIRLNDGSFDEDRCTLQIPVTTPDPYQAFNNNSQDTLNIFHTPGGPVQSVNVFDEAPVYEYNVTALETDGMDFSHQTFAHYPNARAQYPGFGCEGEKADPYWPESSTKIVDNLDLTTLTREPTGTFEEYLATGSIPYHSGYAYYAGAFDAINEGWRLYYFRYKIQSNGATLNMIGLWQWVREIKDVVIGTLMGPEWFFVGIVAGLDRWAKAPTLLPRTNMYKPSFVTVDFPAERQIWFEYTTFIPGVVTTLVDRFDLSLNKYGFETITNGLRLNDVIEYAVNYCDPSLTVKSDFFQINPFTISATNYVTGADTFTNEILLFQKSDIKRAWAPDKATIGNFTPQDLFNWLLYMFKVRYRIHGGLFVLEHVTSPYFEHAIVMDLTAAPYSRFLAALNRYGYDSSIKIPAKQLFTFMESRPDTSFLPADDFAGAPIDYDGNNVDRTKQSGVISYDVANITTDIILILLHGGGLGYVQDNATSNQYPVQASTDDGLISDDGFGMIATWVSGGGDRFGFIEPLIIDDFDRFNNVLGWAYLHKSFHMDYANAKTGSMNNAAVVFSTTKYLKTSTTLSFGFNAITGFDPFAIIHSSMGDGVLKEAEYQIYDNVLRVKLGYR